MEKDITSDTKITLANLEKLTNLSFRCLKRRLQGIEPIQVVGRKHYYCLQDALTAICSTSSTALDVNQARARLANLQADEIELRIAEKKGRLVDANSFLAEYEQRVAGSRDKLRNLASNLAPRLALKSDPTEVFHLLDAAIEEALIELSEEPELNSNNDDDDEDEITE